MRCCEDADASDREKMLKDDYIFEDKKIVIRHHGIRVIKVLGCLSTNKEHWL